MAAPSTPSLPEIRPFDLGRATEQDFADYHVLVAESQQVDMPEEPPVTHERAVGRLRHQPLMGGPCRHWAARVQGRLVGFAEIALLEGHNAGVVFADFTVLPSLRRRGIGAALLRDVIPVLEASGCRIVTCAAKDGSDGARCAQALGFHVTVRTVIQKLAIGDVDPAIWDVPMPPGYRSVRWTGATPDQLLDSYAAARPAIRDAPLGQASYRETAWTPQLIREEEADLAAHGTQQRVVAAVADTTGQVAGLTAMRCYPHRRTNCIQHDTSVVGPHRGHGLGRALKAEMMRWLTAERPELEYVLTSTAAENVHMINVNHAIGYYTLRTIVWNEIPTAQLAQTLASWPTVTADGHTPADGPSGTVEGE